MGQLVDREHLWLHGTPQRSPNWCAWAPFALIPIAAVTAWMLTAPDTSSTPEAGPPIAANATDAPLFHSARVIPALFTPAWRATRAPRSVPPEQPAPTRSTPGRDDSKPDWHRVTIDNGDTLSLAFARNGLSYKDSLRIVHLPHLGHYFTRGLHSGDVLDVKTDAAGRVEKISYRVDALHHLTVKRTDHGFTGSLAERSAEHHHAVAAGVIQDNFYHDALDAGLTDRQAATLRRIFSRAVNFDHDIHPGDRFVAIYDELYQNDEKLGDGPILAAALINKGHVVRAVRYTNSDSHGQFYRPDGHPLRAAFVRAPVAYTHISSPFNLHRMHPILHHIRRHEGTDYAAPKGTPIHATGSGRIIFEGRRGGYGNMVIIRHNKHITMRFAHMARFAQGLHVGNHVSEGQTIGHVGMTGLATGPHVHYEFRIDGKPHDPQSVPLPGAPPLKGSQLAAFKHDDADIIARLDDALDDKTVHVASAAGSH